MKGFLSICAWLDVSFVWKRVPDELYEVSYLPNTTEMTHLKTVRLV
jgi:hypothetical protein